MEISVGVGNKSCINDPAIKHLNQVGQMRQTVVKQEWKEVRILMQQVWTSLSGSVLPRITNPELFVIVVCLCILSEEELT